MTLPAQAALVRANDYHHAIGWLWVCEMLANRQPIISVSVEDSDGGAFDDVVVRRTAGSHLYIQAKSSNYGNVIVDREWLLTSPTPSGRSPLQHFFSTYTDLKESGEQFSLELWTNRGLDHTNPLLGTLHDRKHDKIDTERMLAVGPGSVIGKERHAWATHLGITIEELSEFLAVVSWRHTDSELVIRERAKPLMEIARLRNDDAAVGVGISIVRGWVSDGVGPRSVADVNRQVDDLGLRLDPLDELLEPEPANGRSQPESIGMQNLPPGCRTCLESLLLVSPDDARRIASELSRPASRTPSVLTHLADNPPQWLRDANSLAWDAIVEFSVAHELSGSDTLRRRAVEQGSLRGPLYRVQAALRAADDENLRRARELLAHVPEDYPLFGLARARINDGDQAVVDAIRDLDLRESPDPDIALVANVMFIVAYCRLDDIAQALAALNGAIHRFPERAWLYLQRAELTLSSAMQGGNGGTEHASLLKSAATDAVKARDRFREWGGPSGQAVATAATALMLLNEHARVCNLAVAPPGGEATPEEARHSEVIKCLAEALLVLNRLEDLDSLDIDLLDPPERTRLLALRAHRHGDPDAHKLMRDALEQATDDRTRLQAHHGLALFGELDESALARLSTEDEAYKDAIRAMAHFNRGDYTTAVNFLRPHCRDSLIHAELLAKVQAHSGATEDAIETLETAAEAQGAASLYLGAVELLITDGRLDEAEALALTALSGDVSPSSELGLRHALVDIAGQLQEWSKMESQARALFNGFPEAPLAPWAVIQALVGQVRLRSAWDFIIQHDVSPIDEPTARLAIQVYIGAGELDGVSGRLLDVASTFSESGETAGAALAALMAIRDKIDLTDTQRSLLANMLESYVERFPESQVLQAFQVDALDDLLERIRSVTQAQAQQLADAANSVRNGTMPYGILLAARARPYAELLLSFAAGYLTAISADETQRETERGTVRASIGDNVAVDTSVAALGIRSGTPVDKLTSVFRRVFVADELLFDARATVLSTSLFTAEHVGHIAATGEFSVTPITEQQRQQMRNEASCLVNVMQGWDIVRSARLNSPLSIDEEHRRPWDASLRVAADRQCALWCDDLALRALAESVGIPTFGSYALVEVLTEEDGSEGLPSVAEFKRDLLRAGIADVPLTWGELSEFNEAEESSDLAAIRALDRPLSWTTPMALTWYNGRVEALASDSDHNRLLELVRAACCGRGMSVAPSDREAAIGEVVAATLNTVRLRAADPAERTPGILEASRYACGQIDPSGQLEMLRQAVTVLRNLLIPQFGPALAASIVTRLFAQTTEADRNVVASVILDVGD